MLGDRIVETTNYTLHGNYEENGYEPPTTKVAHAIGGRHATTDSGASIGKTPFVAVPFLIGLGGNGGIRRMGVQ